MYEELIDAAGKKQQWESRSRMVSALRGTGYPTGYPGYWTGVATRHIENQSIDIVCVCLICYDHDELLVMRRTMPIINDYIIIIKLLLLLLL